MNGEKMKRAVSLALSVILVLSCVVNYTGSAEYTIPETEAESKVKQPHEEMAEFEPFIRIDRDDPEAWKRDLANLGIITEGAYKLGKPKDKYGIDPAYIPDLTGLDTLDVSASAQFNEWQFRDMAETLRDKAEGKEIIIFDLRRENHAFLDGLPFSLYGLHN